MIRLGRSILVACAMFALASAAQASTILIFNTGVDANGIPLANGTTPDSHYALTSVPGDTTNILRVRTSAGGFPVPPWIADNVSSAWIGPDSQLEGHYDYRTTFDLTGMNPATAVLTGQWATDNEGVDILINGVSTGLVNTAQFLAWTPLTINSGFVEGVNTLDFIVNNSVAPGDNPNPTGLRVEISGTAAAVPEPVSFVLLGVGLGALGMLRRRKV